MQIRLRDASRTYTISTTRVLYERPVRLASRQSAERFLRRCLRADPLTNRRALDDLLREHGKRSGSATSIARDAAPLVQDLNVTARPRAAGHRLVFGKQGASRSASSPPGRPADLEVQPDGRVTEGASPPVTSDPPSYDPRCIDCGWTQKEATEGDTVTMSLRFEQVPPSARHVLIQVYRRHPDASRTYIEDVRGRLTHADGEATAEIDWTVPGTSAEQGGKRIEGSYVFRATIPETGTRVGSGRGPRTHGMLRVQGYWEVVFAISDEFEPLTVSPADGADVHGRPLHLTDISAQETAPSIDIPTGQMCRVGVPLRWGGDLVLTREGQTVGRITQDQLTGGPDPDEPFWYVLAGPNASFDLPERSTDRALDAVGDDATGALGDVPTNPDEMAREMATEAAADHVAVPDAIDDVVPPPGLVPERVIVKEVPSDLQHDGRSFGETVRDLADLTKEEADWLFEVLFGNVKTMDFGKVTKKLVKLATEDKNLLRYMFSKGAKVKVFERSGGNMEVILSGSARIEFQNALPRMLDANSGRDAIFVEFDWSKGAGGKVASNLKGQFTGVNGVFMLAAVGHDFWRWTETNGADFADLMVEVGITISKALITEAVVTGLLGALAAFGLLGATTPVWLIVVGVLAFSVGIGLALDYVDNQLGISERIHRTVDNLQNWFQSNVARPIDYKFRKLIYEIESGVAQRRLNGF